MGSKLVVHSLVATLLLGYAVPVWSQEDTSKSTIEKAIQAQGGAENLAKIKVSKEKTKGVIYIGGMEFSFKTETSQQLPNQSKVVVALDVGGMQLAIIEVINGDKGWTSINGQTKDADEKEFALMKESIHSSYVNTLLPLLNDKGFELKSLGETKVDGKVAVGVKVSFKGRHDNKLYFDKDSGLLVKVSRPGQDPVAKAAVTQDEFYSDYKVVDGVKLPHRVVVHHDGKKFMEADFLEFTFVKSFDAKMFARPQ
jgi:hypothetical protein